MYRLIYFGFRCWTDNGLLLDVERGYKDTRDCTPFYFLVDLPECSQQLVSPRQSHFASLSLCLLGQDAPLANGHISVIPYAGVCPEVPRGEGSISQTLGPLPAALFSLCSSCCCLRAASASGLWSFNATIDTVSDFPQRKRTRSRPPSPRAAAHPGCCHLELFAICLVVSKILPFPVKSFPKWPPLF